MQNARIAWVVAAPTEAYAGDMAAKPNVLIASKNALDAIFTPNILLFLFNFSGFFFSFLNRYYALYAFSFHLHQSVVKFP